MNLEWITKQLRTNGAKEVLEALENATNEDLNKLAVSVLSTSATMKLCGYKKYGDTPEYDKSDAQV